MNTSTFHSDTWPHKLPKRLFQLTSSPETHRSAKSEFCVALPEACSLFFGPCLAAPGETEHPFSPYLVFAREAAQTAHAQSWLFSHSIASLVLNKK